MQNKDFGSTEHHPLNAIAVKPETPEIWTELKDIEWSMGRSGILTPVAIFNPVEIEGTIVEKASLSNLSILKKTLGEQPFIEQEVSVTKRNCIIPKIERAKDERGEWIV